MLSVKILPSRSPPRASPSHSLRGDFAFALLRLRLWPVEGEASCLLPPVLLARVEVPPPPSVSLLWRRFLLVALVLLSRVCSWVALVPPFLVFMPVFLVILLLWHWRPVLLAVLLSPRPSLSFPPANPAVPLQPLILSLLATFLTASTRHLQSLHLIRSLPLLPPRLFGRTATWSLIRPLRCLVRPLTGQHHVPVLCFPLSPNVGFPPLPRLSPAMALSPPR